MTQIEKLVSYIETIFQHSPSDQYQVKELESGTPILLDYANRIRIVIHVQEIMVTKYSDDDGRVLHEIVVSWQHLTTAQRNRIVELVDIPDDLDPEVEDSLNDILKGI